MCSRVVFVFLGSLRRFAEVRLSCPQETPETKEKAAMGIQDSVTLTRIDLTNLLGMLRLGSLALGLSPGSFDEGLACLKARLSVRSYYVLKGAQPCPAQGSPLGETSACGRANYAGYASCRAQRSGAMV